MTTDLPFEMIFLKGGEIEMQAMWKECSSPHSLAHFVTGAGIILLVAAYIPAVAANALILGLILLVAGVVWDFMVNPAKKK